MHPDRAGALQSVQNGRATFAELARPRGRSVSAWEAREEKSLTATHTRVTLLVIVTVNIEAVYAIRIDWTHQDAGMAQRPHRVVVTSTPVPLHSRPREFIVLRISLICPGANQMNKVVDFSVRDRTQEFSGWVALHAFGKVIKRGRDGIAHTLGMFELIRAGAGATRVVDFFAPAFPLRQDCRDNSPRAFQRST
jgi:hypothetical protein